MKILKLLLATVFCATFLLPNSQAEELRFAHPNGGSLFSFQTDTTDTTKADTTEEEDKDLPLEAARTVELNTTEGTWISVDISPNGEEIAFDMMGDIYTMPFEGGEAEKVTEGMAFDAHPRYSPDGKYLLFTSDRDGSDEIWYINLETEETTQVTKGKYDHYPSAEWTGDGKYIIAAKGGLTHKLHMYHKDGGKGVQLIDEPGNLKTIDPAIGADDRFIYYSRRMGSWNYNAQLPQYQIGVYDRENAETSVITSRYGSAFTPVLSPDGQWLVYGSRYEDQTGLVIRNLDNGNERWLAYPVQRDDQESRATMGVYPGMSFTPDSEELVAYYGGKIWRIPVGGGEATEIPFEVDTEIELGPRLDFDYPISDDEKAIATQIRDAVPSPDKDQLAFTVMNRLYVMDFPGGTPQRLTDMNITEAQPTWSPDGEWIAYAGWNPDEETGHLYKVRSDGDGDPVQLTQESAIYGEPAWSYNSDRIVFLKGTAESYRDGIGPGAFFGSLEDIAWVPADGGEATFVAKADGRNNPHFVKGNDRIYLNDDNTLVSIRWDGTDEKEYIEVTGITTAGFGERDGIPKEERILHPEAAKENNPPSEASEIMMAPEGDQALAQINNEIYVMTVPKIGEKIDISVASPDNSQFPARKLTEIGGQFPAWGSEGRKVHWSIGNGHFIYDLDAARAFEDSVKAAKKAEEEEKEESEKSEEEKVEKEEEKEKDKKEEEVDKYEPEEYRIEVTYQRDIPEGTALLQGARVITMNGDEVIEKGDILVENDRISAVGATGTLDVPSDAEVIDVSDKTIIPGFVDTHAHMWPTWGIHKNEIWNYWANLAYGVTTTRDPQTSTTDILSYADMVNAGRMLGPRVYSTGPGVGFWAYDIRDLDHAKDVLKQYSEYYHTKYIKMYIAGNRQQRQWIIMAAKDQKIMPTTEGALDWKLNLNQLIDGYPGHEHSFPIYPIYDEVVNVVAESKMAVTPTLLVSYGGPWAENYYYATDKPYNSSKLLHFTPYAELASKSRRRGFWSMYEEHVFQKHAEFMKDLVNAGGWGGVGSHGQLEGLGYHWELWATQAGGMSNHNALKVATILGAKSLGLDNDLGSIEAGKLADLIVLDRNPLEKIRNTNSSVRYVMKNGRLYEGRTLDEIYPREREAPERWWGNEKPANSLPGMSDK